MLFGKRISEYLDFQRVFLILIAGVGLARLWLSLAGQPNSTVRFLSMNVVAWAGAFYYGVAVHTRRFGSYKQLLPLGLFQTILQQLIAVAGILLAISGRPNIFAAPEYSFAAQSQWTHLAAHLTVGLVVPPLLLWAVSSLVLLVTRKTSGQPATA
jgi:hypothetical protein